jgi:hypothetical protein
VTEKSPLAGKAGLAVIAALVVLVVVLAVLRMGGNKVPEPEGPGASPSQSSQAGAVATPTASTATASALTDAAAARPLRRVLLHIDGIRLLYPAKGLVRARLRANVNSAYYDFPAVDPDGGVRPFVVAPELSLGDRDVPRSFQYEVYFEMSVGGRETISGDAETLDLTSPGGTVSDKLPYHEEYKLYRMAHGARAPSPSAVVAFSLLEGP